MPATQKRNWKGRPRIHDHHLVQITYRDKEVFRRVYTNKEKAVSFANRQKKSPVVKNVTVRKIN